MGNKTKEYYFIESFIKYIDSNSYFDSDDEIQRTFIMNIKNSNITLIIKPNIIKKAEKYNINYTKKKDNSYSFGIDYSPNDDNKINDSYSNSFKELLNNNKIIINEKNLDERNKIEKIENLNKNDSQFLNHNKPLTQKEESKDNKNILKRSKSSQKANLKFGNKMEHVNIESKKSKENKEKYLNPLEVIEGKNNNEIKPKGLYNFSLNNYMNSLLQCLFHIKELREYFINNQNKFTDDRPVCKAFAEVMNELKNSDNDYVEPKRFKKLIGKDNKLFLGCKAGDVKNLFINLIDTFLTELNKENINEVSTNNNIDYTDKKQMFREALKEIDNNIINKIFIGYYETMYQCTKKSISINSIQTESFLLFELEKIKNYFDTKKLSLELCFKYYYREQLNTEFYCSGCQKTHKGNAYEKIYRPPKILLIVLDRGHGKTFKGDVEINKYLDLKNIIDEDEFKYSSLYKLICVSTHKGKSSSSGQYTACCLADNNKYYYFNDKYVQEIDENNIINDEPYLLFYKQIDNEDKNEIEKIKKETKIIKINKENIQNNNFISNNNKNFKFYKDLNNEKENKKINYKDILYQKNKQNNTLNISDENKSNHVNKYISRFKVYNTIENERALNKNEDKNDLYSTKKNYSKYKTYKIDYQEIKSALKQFKRNSNTFYEVDYYYPKNNYPYAWKLKIKGQKNTPYYGKILNFKLDFNKSFKYITDNIKLEDHIYHLNFLENGILLFDIEYKENKSFYDNLKELFNLLCNLFIEPNCELSIKYSREKINLYKNNREEYNKKVRESLYN